MHLCKAVSFPLAALLRLCMGALQCRELTFQALSLCLQAGHLLGA